MPYTSIINNTDPRDEVTITFQQWENGQITGTNVIQLPRNTPLPWPDTFNTITFDNHQGEASIDRNAAQGNQQYHVRWCNQN